MKISTRIKRLLNKLEIAARNDEFRGAAHPDDRDQIHQHYKDTRAKVEAALIMLAWIPPEQESNNV